MASNLAISNRPVENFRFEVKAQVKAFAMGQANDRAFSIKCSKSANQPMPEATETQTKRFTIDLEQHLHQKLSLRAVRTGRTKADIVRELLERELKDVKD